MEKKNFSGVWECDQVVRIGKLGMALNVHTGQECADDSTRYNNVATTFQFHMVSVHCFCGRVSQALDGLRQKVFSPQSFVAIMWRCPKIGVPLKHPF